MKQRKRRAQPALPVWLDPSIVFVVALVHRILFLLSNRDAAWPFSVFYFGDTRIFYEEALGLLSGARLEQGIPFHPPGFIYLLTWIYRLAGVDPASGSVNHFAVKALVACFGAGAMTVLYITLRRQFGRSFAIAGTALSVYHFGQYVISIAPVGDAFFLFLLTLFIELSMRGKQPDKVIALVLGLVGGLMVLTRAESILIILGLVVLTGWHRRWIPIAIGMLLVVLPWTIRNNLSLRAYNRQHTNAGAQPLPTWVPVTLYGKINLALANHPGADGSFKLDALDAFNDDPTLDLENPDHLDYLLNGHHKAIAFWLNEPAEATILVFKKWAKLFDAFSLGWTQWDLPGGLAGKRRPVDIFTPTNKLALVTIPCVLLALILLWRDGDDQRRWASIVAWIWLCQMAVTAAFFGYARLGVLVMPLMLSVIPRLLDRPLRAIEASKPMKLGALGCAVLLFIAALVASFSTRTFQATGSTIPGTSKLNQDATIALKPIPADARER